MALSAATTVRSAPKTGTAMPSHSETPMPGRATNPRRLTSAMFDLLRHRGRLLVANFLPNVDDIGYMESFMDWKLIYRSRLEMLDISSEIPQAEIRDIRIFTEENENIIFLQITKK